MPPSQSPSPDAPAADLQVATPQQPLVSRQKQNAATASKPLRVTGKLKVACDLMVWGRDGQGLALPWDQAARAADLTVQSMRRALQRPHVQQYLKAERQVFRASASAANISRAVQLRDQNDNKTAAVQAMRYLDETADERAAAPGRVTNPGIVIVIGAPRDGRMTVDQGLIELNQLESLEPVGIDDSQRRG